MVNDPDFDRCVKLKISEVEIKDPRWQDLHYKTLSLGYAKAPFFHQLKPLLEETYIQQQWKNLSTVNRFFDRKDLDTIRH
jgi:hypothetical protein